MDPVGFHHYGLSYMLVIHIGETSCFRKDPPTALVKKKPSAVFVVDIDQPTIHCGEQKVLRLFVVLEPKWLRYALLDHSFLSCIFLL